MDLKLLFGPLRVIELRANLKKKYKFIFWYPYGLGDIVMLCPLIHEIKNSNIPLEDHLFIFKDNASVKLAHEYFPELECFVFKRKIFSRNFLDFLFFASSCKKIIAPMLSRKFQSYLPLLIFFKDTYVPNNFFSQSFLWLKNLSTNLLSFKGHQSMYLMYAYSKVNKIFTYKDSSSYKVKPLNLRDVSKNNEKNIVAVGLSCGPHERHKLPSARYFAKFINLMHEYIDLEVFLFGISSDRDLMSNFKENLLPNINCRELIDLDFSDLFNHISICNFGIAGTTGQGHMFASTGIKMITFSGVTDFEKNGPLSENQIPLSHDFKCGPCYSDDYQYGCKNIACMDYIPLEDSVKKTLNFLKEEKDELRVKLI